MKEQHDIDDLARGKILGALALGGSLEDGADCAGVTHKAVRRHFRSNAAFAREAREHVARGKMYHLKKVGMAPQWQASKFILESKWPEEFGRGAKAEENEGEVRIQIRRVRLPPKPPGVGG